MLECKTCGEDSDDLVDGLCVACKADRDSYYRGAICGRCDVDLDPEGYCQNDRCPFFTFHQDDPVDHSPLDDEEWEYIQNVVLPRLAGGQQEPGGEL